jgi:hypothetical protein
MKKLVIALGAIAVLAPPAFASGASLKVSPSTANEGSKVRVYGSVGHGCQVGKPGDSATLYSKAFSSSHNFAGVPSVSAPLDSKGNFSVKVKTKKTTGLFTVSGRCGGGKFGSAKLTLVIGGY